MARTVSWCMCRAIFQAVPALLRGAAPTCDRPRERPLHTHDHALQACEWRMQAGPLRFAARPRTTCAMFYKRLWLLNHTQHRQAALIITQLCACVHVCRAVRASLGPATVQPCLKTAARLPAPCLNANACSQQGGDLPAADCRRQLSGAGRGLESTGRRAPHLWEHPWLRTPSYSTNDSGSGCTGTFQLCVRRRLGISWAAPVPAGGRLGVRAGGAASLPAL